jgi:hypothetical protein
MMDDFRPTARLRFHGDPGELARLRHAALRELEAMHRENVFDLPVYSRSLTLPTGERIECRRMGIQDCLVIQAPQPREKARPQPVERAWPVAAPGSFYAIPGCLARYEGLANLDNAIPDGTLAGWSLGLGQAVTVGGRGAAGLPEAQGLPEAGLDREVGVFTLPGGSASGLLFGRSHIPDNAPFSVSCLVRLRQPLEYDYTYDHRGVLNPFRIYFLQTQDGEHFTWDCPGAISPLLGFCSPHLHPGWSETATYPWAPWNEDFSRKVERLAGAKRLEASPCADAPLLAGDGYTDALGQPYPHPYGFILGLQAAGLFVYNGNRLLGARISDFDSQIGYTPVVTDPLDYAVWHHAVFTHDADGTARVYLARQDRSDAWVYEGIQPLCTMDAACQYTVCGVNAWTLHNGLTGADIGAYRMNPVMEVALPRFFHYALSADQAYLLQLEALEGLFVADDHEMAQGAAMGMTSITIE